MCTNKTIVAPKDNEATISLILYFCIPYWALIRLHLKDIIIHSPGSSHCYVNGRSSDKVGFAVLRKTSPHCTAHNSCLNFVFCPTHPDLGRGNFQPEQKRDFVFAPKWQCRSSIRICSTIYTFKRIVTGRIHCTSIGILLFRRLIFFYQFENRFLPSRTA